LHALVHELDLRDLTLVVHDFGGPIGLPLLLDEPERVRSLVIVNTWAWPHGSDPKVARVSRFVASPLGRFLYLWLNASPRWLVPASAVEKAAFSPAVRRHYTGPFGAREERIAPWMLGCELAGSDAFYASLWERRWQLQAKPASLIWGERDIAFGPAYLARWRELLPEARVTSLRTGHFPQEEAPDEFITALRAAL
jgi:haloalkane dehalogenase